MAALVCLFLYCHFHLLIYTIHLYACFCIKCGNIDNTQSAEYNKNVTGGGNYDRAGSIGSDQTRVSGVYGTSGTGYQGRIERQGVSVDSRLVLLSPSAKSVLKQRGVVDVELHESSTDNTSFSSALAAARKADRANGWAVTFKDARLWMRKMSGHLWIQTERPVLELPPMEISKNSNKKRPKWAQKIF